MSIDYDKFLINLLDIKNALNDEAKSYDNKDGSKYRKIVETITYYSISVEILHHFIKEKNINAFIETFKSRNITLKGLNKCFCRKDEESLQQKNMVLQKLKDMTDKIIMSLKV